MQIGPLSSWLQEGLGGGATGAASRCALRNCETRLNWPVQIGVRVANVFAGLRKGDRDRRGIRRRRNSQVATGAVESCVREYRCICVPSAFKPVAVQQSALVRWRPTDCPGSVWWKGKSDKE